MAGIKSLGSRIDAEFSAVVEKTKMLRADSMEDYRGRQKRVEQC